MAVRLAVTSLIFCLCVLNYDSSINRYKTMAFEPSFEALRNPEVMQREMWRKW
jgi:hypothetical protein